MAPAASAANAKSLKAHCTQADGSKPPSAQANTLTQKSKQSHHHRDCHDTQQDQAATTAAAEAVAAEAAPENATPTMAIRSPSAHYSHSRKNRDEANKKAKDREAYYDALGSDEDDEVMREMMDLSDTVDEEDKPVTQKKGNTRTGIARSVTMTTRKTARHPTQQTPPSPTQKTPPKAPSHSASSTRNPWQRKGKNPSPSLRPRTENTKNGRPPRRPPNPSNIRQLTKTHRKTPNHTAQAQLLRRTKTTLQRKIRKGRPRSHHGNRRE
jgi:hypothetical protein